jgi:hypothetical protein
MPLAVGPVKSPRFTSEQSLFASGKWPIFDLTQAAEAAS